MFRALRIPVGDFLLKMMTAINSLETILGGRKFHLIRLHASRQIRISTLSFPSIDVVRPEIPRTDFWCSQCSWERCCSVICYLRFLGNWTLNRFTDSNEGGDRSLDKRNGLATRHSNEQWQNYWAIASSLFHPLMPLRIRSRLRATKCKTNANLLQYY